MSEFFVGQKVVCVDDDGGAGDPAWPRDNWAIRNGQEYTVRWTGISPRGNYAIKLLEVDRGKYDGRDSPFRATRFRPLETKAISIFRAIAQGVTDGRPVVDDQAFDDALTAEALCRFMVELRGRSLL